VKGAAMSTARGVALVRALEMQRPEAERISSDPYAVRFADPVLLWLTKLMIASGASRLVGIEGMINFALLRERYVDDVMHGELADGAEQIVVLGAGFDTRAYRIDRPDVVVFEVDHPDTQADKRRSLASAGIQLPANIRFVPVDFDIDDLGACLRTAGYDAKRRTVFVWQGVVFYLTQTGVDHTLAFIAQNTHPQSFTVFDYGYVENKRQMSWFVRLYTSLVREKMLFGLPRGGLATYLAPRGFDVVANVECPELRDRYVPASRRFPVTDGVAIATVRVHR
jgi:methyltransferase (TIGR00027 family)